MQEGAMSPPLPRTLSRRPGARSNPRCSQRGQGAGPGSRGWWRRRLWTPLVPVELTAARWLTGPAELGGRRGRTRLCPGVLRRRSQVPVRGHRHQAGRGAAEAAPEGDLEVRPWHVAASRPEVAAAAGGHGPVGRAPCVAWAPPGDRPAGRARPAHPLPGSRSPFRFAGGRLQTFTVYRWGRTGPMRASRGGRVGSTLASRSPSRAPRPAGSPGPASAGPARACAVRPRRGTRRSQRMGPQCWPSTRVPLSGPGRAGGGGPSAGDRSGPRSARHMARHAAGRCTRAAVCRSHLLCISGFRGPNRRIWGTTRSSWSGCHRTTCSVSRGAAPGARGGPRARDALPRGCAVRALFPSHPTAEVRGVRQWP